MKKKTKLIALTLILVLLLTACGAEANGFATQDTKTEETMEYVVEESMDFSANSLVMEEVEAETEEPQTAVTPEEAKAYAEKIIYSGNVYVETTDFDGSVASLEQAVAQYNGFIQDSNISGRSNGDRTAVVDRYAFYVVRIPTQHFDAFMSLTGQIGNVTSSGRRAENVTSQYTDYQARLSSLKTQEERLLEMLGTSGDLESLIALEQRLSEVRYEIESIERNLRNLDQKLAYSTVNIDLQEVEIYTQTAPVQRSFGEKLADSFSDGWQGFAKGCQGFVIWLAGSLPTLILLAAIVTGVIVVIRKQKTKRRTPPQVKEDPKEEPKE